VNRVVIQKGLDRQLVLYWYQSQRRVVASEYWGKIYTVVDAVRYNRTDAALVRLVLPIPANAAVADVEQEGIAFAQALFPHLAQHLPS
jgi:EpsI family protein